MTTKWSALLSKETLSDFLVDDAVREARDTMAPETKNLLRTRIEEKKQISNLKKALKSLKKIISQDTYQALLDELGEIAEDFAWKKSERGQYVSRIQDWAQTFHAEFRGIQAFEDVYIGGHAEREVVFVTGKVKTETDYQHILDFILSKQPPYKLLAKIAISEQPQ